MQRHSDSKCPPAIEVGRTHTHTQHAAAGGWQARPHQQAHSPCRRRCSRSGRRGKWCRRRRCKGQQIHVCVEMAGRQLGRHVCRALDVAGAIQQPHCMSSRPAVACCCILPCMHTAARSTMILTSSARPRWCSAAWVGTGSVVSVQLSAAACSAICEPRCPPLKWDAHTHTQHAAEWAGHACSPLPSPLTVQTPLQQVWPLGQTVPQAPLQGWSEGQQMVRLGQR